MKIEEFINKCDYEGGLSELFDYGIDEEDIANIELDENSQIKKTIMSAYKAWKEYKKFEDEYYYLAEEESY